MSSINRVTLVGVLGADPEVKDINGKRMASLRLATNEKWKDNTGAWQERTDWHTVVVWNDYFAGMLADQARKGTRVMVEGKLATRKWKDQQGQDRYSTEVIVQGLAHQVMIGVAGPRSDDQQHGGRSGDRSARGGQQRQAPPAAGLDDDLPW